MLRQYDLLENVLIDIEKGIREGINSDILAEKYTLSERHLRKLFKFAFKQPLGGYIRSRRLAASLDDLLKTDFNILDIAIEHGFEYEQSYRRAFKREFGITPGNLRKAGHIANRRII
jgi:AraC family transcriptional regulator